MTVVGASLVVQWNIVAVEYWRTVEDAERSLKRYVALALGDTWEVRLSDEEGTFDPPFAVVTRVGEASNTVMPEWTDTRANFNIALAPVVQDTIEEAKVQASRLEQVLFRAIAGGNVSGGHPMRIPLYSYDGVPLSLGSNARRGYDYLRVFQFATQSLVDADVPRQVTVMADVRVEWRRPTRMATSGTVVQSMQIDPEVVS